MLLIVAAYADVVVVVKKEAFDHRHLRKPSFKLNDRIREREKERYSSLIKVFLFMYLFCHYSYSFTKISQNYY